MPRLPFSMNAFDCRPIARHLKILKLNIDKASMTLANIVNLKIAIGKYFVSNIGIDFTSEYKTRTLTYFENGKHRHVL